MLFQWEFSIRTLVACILALALPAGLLAQASRAGLTGRVTDSSGAVVPAATVVALNTDTNSSYKGVTNEAGLYQIPYLLPGNYQITLQVPGFKSYVRQGLVVNVDSTVTVDVALEVGTVTESVNVTAASPVLETSTASSGQIMDNRRVRDLPLTGNNAFLITGLAPGMQRTDYRYVGLHDTDYSINARSAGGVGTNEMLLDGSPNSGKQNRTAYVPYADAVEEIRVESTSFEASVGHSASAFVSMLSKAGTNQYHGTFTESHWQQRLNATSSADSGAYWGKIKAAEAAGNLDLAKQLRSEPRQPSAHSNNYGASIGGPVILPRLYDGRDKLFFFFLFNGYNDRRLENPGSKIYTVPTAEERQGDFSRLLRINAPKYQIYDPLSTKLDPATRQFVRTPFVGNVIPSNRFINPIYKFYEKFYPLPNNPPQMNLEGGNNYYAAGQPANWDYWGVHNRMDYAHSEKNRFFLRWNHYDFVRDYNDWTYQSARGLMSDYRHRRESGGTFDYVHTFNATTILNLAAGVSQYFAGNANAIIAGYKPSDVGLPKYLDDRAGDKHVLPRVTFNAYRAIGQTLDLGERITAANLRAEFSRYVGKHSVRSGWDGRQYSYAVASQGFNSSGSFSFTNNLLRQTSSATGIGNMGFDWAAFLIGIPNSMDIDTIDSRYATTPYHSVYVQDTWRFSSSLTFTLGLRLEYAGSIKERYNRGLRDFDPGAQVAFTAAAQAAYAASPIAEVPASQFTVRGGVHYLGQGVPRTLSDPTLRAMPRMGFAWKIGAKTVIRGGYGFYFDAFDTHAYADGFDQYGYSRPTSTIITDDQGVTWNAGDPVRGVSPLADPFPLRPDGTRFDTPFGNALGVNAYYGRSYAYVYPQLEPAKLHRWRLEIQRQLSDQSVFSIAYAGSWAGNVGLTQQQNPLAEQYWASGLTRNNAVASNLTQNVTNPFYVGNLGLVQDRALSLYVNTNSFFTSRTIQKNRLMRPFPHMGSISRRYTTAGKNSYNGLQAGYEKRFGGGWTLNTNYEWSHTLVKDWYPNEFDPLPLWRESNNSRPHRWTASGIYEFPFGKGRRWLNRGGIRDAVLGGWQVGAIWQMQSGSAIDFGNVFYYGSNHRDIAFPGGLPNADRWFNTDNFERDSTKAPTSFHRTVFPSRFNWLRTMPLKQLDANLQKTFRVKEALQADLRVDLLNAPNHQVLGGPNTDPTSASFGRVTSWVNTPRYIQFQLRLRF